MCDRKTLIRVRIGYCVFPEIRIPLISGDSYTEEYRVDFGGFQVIETQKIYFEDINKIIIATTITKYYPDRQEILYNHKRHCQSSALVQFQDHLRGGLIKP